MAERSQKKVLIGCPTYSRYKYCIDEYLQSVKNIDHDHYDLLLVDNSPDDDFFRELKSKGVNIVKIAHCEPARERITRSRNVLRDRVIDGGYDYFLSLEQDIIVRPDILKKLLSHNKDIVTAYYGNDMVLTVKHKQTGELKKVRLNLPLVYVKGSEGKIRRANPKDVLKKGLVEVGAMGLGCVLISTEVLKKVKFRYDPKKKSFDDMYFCKDAKDAGYKLYIDGNAIVQHVHKRWDDVVER
ncbi:MAG: hypothetical protein V1729_06170 [Candidatus Woesearchaeota archaeon]